MDKEKNLQSDGLAFIRGEGLQMLNAFIKIRDPAIRKSVMLFLESLANSDQRTDYDESDNIIRFP